MMDNTDHFIRRSNRLERERIFDRLIAKALTELGHGRHMDRKRSRPGALIESLDVDTRAVLRTATADDLNKTTYLAYACHDPNSFENITGQKPIWAIR